MKLKKEQQEFIASLYLKMYKELFLYSYYSLRDASSAEEAVQETFAVVCEKADVFCHSENPQGWVMNVLKNVLHRSFRELAVRKKYLADAEPSLSENIALFGHELDDMLTEYAYMASLKAEENLMLRKVALEGVALQEVADELEISLSASQKRWQRLKRKMRERLKNEQ